MKIGVISDTHIPEKAQRIPQAALDAFSQVDMVVHAGDLVDPRVLAQLKQACPRVVAVRGNMDPPEVRVKLREKEVFKAGAYTVAVMHGYGHPEHLIEVLEKELKDDKPDIVIFGHSHTPTKKTHHGVLFFNPGSATDTVFAPYQSYGIIEINGGIKATIVKLQKPVP